MNFPLVLNNIVPKVEYFIIQIDNDMYDNMYFVKHRDCTDFLPQVGLFTVIEEAFLGRDNLVGTVEVTCNIDSAYVLNDYIDAWSSEKAIKLRQGMWIGK